MLIKNINKAISSISQNEEIHKVVEGIADVPKEIRDHLIKFPEWSDVVEPIKKEILDKIHGIEEIIETGIEDKESIEINKSKSKK